MSAVVFLYNTVILTIVLPIKRSFHSVILAWGKLGLDKSEMKSSQRQYNNSILVLNVDLVRLDQNTSKSLTLVSRVLS